jgi:hypothetical protein
MGAGVARIDGSSETLSGLLVAGDPSAVEGALDWSALATVVRR